MSWAILSAIAQHDAERARAVDGRDAAAVEYARKEPGLEPAPDGALRDAGEEREVGHRHVFELAGAIETVLNGHGILIVNVNLNVTGPVGGVPVSAALEAEPKLLLAVRTNVCVPGVNSDAASGAVHRVALATAAHVCVRRMGALLSILSV